MFVLYVLIRGIMSFFNFSGFRSPPNNNNRGSSLIPSPTSPICFSTSPSQLQEVTMEPDFTLSARSGEKRFRLKGRTMLSQEYVKAAIRNSLVERNYDCESASSLCSHMSADEEISGCRGGSQNTMNTTSPSGGTSRGISVKDFEEQLTTLKKENFNLKLRIFFLEEKMGIHFDLNKENIVKKNIELSVDVENLKKELQEKHELLCQAVTAMELEDDEHKKILQDKDENLLHYQQEIEDLKTHIQELKCDNEDGQSYKSYPSDSVSFYAAEAFNLPVGNKVKDLQEQIEQLEKELSKEKARSASLQISSDQAETLQAEYDSLKREIGEKNRKIESLQEQLQQANLNISAYEKCMKDLEQKVERLNDLYEGSNKKLQDKNKIIDDMLRQNEEIGKKYEDCKCELDKEHKRVNRIKMMGDLKVTQMEEENERQRHKTREVQQKLEVALMEVKKNQNLAVSKSPVYFPSTANTDVGSFSVENPATPTGVTQTDSLHVPLKPQSSPSTPEVLDDCFIEEILQGNLALPSARLAEQLRALKTEHDTQRHKIVKLKAEQLKACKIIKGMIDSRNRHTKEKEELKRQVDELQKRLESVKDKVEESDSCYGSPKNGRLFEADDGDNSPDNDKKTMMDFQDDGAQLLEHYKTLTEQLDEKIQILVETMKEKDSQIAMLKQQHEEIEQNLQQREDKIVDLEFELLSCQNKNSIKRSLFTDKTDEGSEKDESYYLRQIEERDQEIEKLNCQIEKLTTEVKKRTGDLQNIVNKELWEKNRHIEKLESRHNTTLGIKDKEISELKSTLSSKDIQLRVIIDRISELGIEIDISNPDAPNFENSSVGVGVGVGDIKVLQEQIKTLTEEKRNLESELQKLSLPLDDEKNKFFEKLREEFTNLQVEYERSEKLRIEANEICSVLSSRLEELAIFLDSLLKQRSVLGFLGSNENRKLKLIIDQSLDLSRTFTMSMIENPDKSLTQLTNLTQILNSSELDKPEESIKDGNISYSIIPDDITLSYRSHLYVSKASKSNDALQDCDIIQALRHQVENLKFELQLRDVELSKLNEVLYSQKGVDSEIDARSKTHAIGDSTQRNKKEIVKILNTSSTLKCRSENQSESEAWSEPDRSVSRARIGLDSGSRPSSAGKRSKLTCMASSASTAEEDGSAMLNSSSAKENSRLSRTPSKRSLSENRLAIVELHKQICLLEEKLLDRDNTIATLREKNLQVNNLLKEATCNTKKAETELRNLEVQVKDLENKMIAVENQKILAEKRVSEMEVLLEDLQKEKDAIENNAEQISREARDRVNNIETEKNRLEVEVREMAISAQNSNKQLIALQEELRDKEATLRKEYEDQVIIKLKNAEEEFLKLLKTAEQNAQKELSAMRETIKNMDLDCATNHIKKCEVDGMCNEIDLFKIAIKEYEATIESLKYKEQLQNDALRECTETVNQLKKSLENVTTEYSEVISSKSKIEKERADLELQLSNAGQKEEQMKKEMVQIQSELFNCKENYQEQLLQLMNQKATLEMRMSELESSNAELYNRVCNMKSKGEVAYSSSLPSGSGSLLDVANRSVNYKRQLSDNTSASEDPHDCRGIYPYNRALQIPQNLPADLERHEANSSPDLGIESDHGRFSSLETNVARPLLQSLELTESMNNLLDGENNVPPGVPCGDERCCKKAFEMNSENVNLRNELRRTRRALEDTFTQLTLANQRKKQVEKTICRQIHKTSQVLRQAKANLDSGSETDLNNKK